MFSRLTRVVREFIENHWIGRQGSEEERLQLRTLIDAIPDYVYFKDAESRFVINNRAHQLLLGAASQEELIGKSDIDYFSSENSEQFLADEQLLLRSGQPIMDVHEWVTNSDGKRCLHLTTKVPLKDRHGQIMGLVGITRDITDAHKVEESLHKISSRNQALLSALPDAIVHIRQDGTVMDIKPPMSYSSPAPAELLRGKNQKDFMPPDLAQRIGYYTNQALDTGVLQTFEHAERIGQQIRTREARVMPTAPNEVVAIIRDVTERRQAKEALAQSESFNQSVLDSLNAHIAVLDNTGTIITVNEPWMRYARENGSHSAEGIGVGANYLAVSESVEGEYAAEARAANAGIRAVMQGKMSHFTMEYPCHSPTAKHWFRLNAVPLVESAGGVVVSHTDITERKVAEEALRGSEARNRALLEAIPDAIVHIRGDGTLLDVKAATDAPMLYDPTEIIGQNQYDLQPSELVWMFQQRNRKVLETQALQTLEFEIQIDGEKRIRESRAVPSGEDEIIAIVRDITDSKQQEEALRHSEARHRALLEAVPDGIVRINRDGIYLDVKAPMEFISLAPEAQMIGKHVRDILPPDIARLALFYNDQALETDEPQTFEFELEREGEIRVREARVVPSGKDEVMVMVRDFTERTRAQAHTSRLLAEVQSQSDELRALQQRLAETQEGERRGMARELHDQVGQNLSTLGLNLNVVQRRVETDLPHAEQIHALLTDSRELLKQTTERVRNVMAELRPPVLDDFGLCPALGWYAEQIAQRVGFTVSMGAPEIYPRLPTAVENALFRITQEAMTNIMKHAQATHVQVRLQADDDTICLTITDDGHGFDLTELADSSVRKSWGLLTMRERAEAVGGRFTIKSQNGSGTTVKVEIDR